MNNKTSTLEDAIAIAAEAHKGQKDKAGASYILHPLRMMMRLNSEAEMMTAILHDVIEDTRNNLDENKWTFEKLREKGFSEEVLEAIEGVTNREDERYEQFIERAGKNPISRRVKIADLEDNMDIKRLETLTDKDATRIAKYLRAWTLLTAKTNDSDTNTLSIKSNTTPDSSTNTTQTQNDLTTTCEPSTHSTENRSYKLTPEEKKMMDDLWAKTSKAIVKGLDKQNKEGLN